MLPRSLEHQDPTIRIARTIAEIEELRAFWTLSWTHRDADPDFYLLYLEMYPEVRPYVIVVQRAGRPIAMLIGRLEQRCMDITFGYWHLPLPTLRSLTFMYKGLVGEISKQEAERVISCIDQSLCAGEADVAVFDYLDTKSALYECARSYRSMRVDHFQAPRVHRATIVPKERKSFIDCLSSHERNNHKRRVRRLNEAFGGKLRVVRFDDAPGIDRLMQDAEAVTKVSYQRGLRVGFVDTPQMRQRLELEARKNWLCARVLYLNECPAAYWIASFHRGTLYSDFMAFTPDYARSGPGMYLVINVIEEMHRNTNNEILRIDFGIGDSEWKTILSNDSWEEATISIFAPRLRSLAIHAVRIIGVLLAKLLRAFLEGANLLPKIKRIWRGRRTPNSARPPRIEGR